MSGVRRDYDQPHDPLNIELSKGDGWTYEKVMRMPDDDHLRATTPDGNEARIRVAHRLGLEIMYRVKGEDEDKVLKLSEEVVIASVSQTSRVREAVLGIWADRAGLHLLLQCRLHRGSVLLPAYGAPPVEHVSHPADTPCRCWYTAQEQYHREGEGQAGVGSDLSWVGDVGDSVAVAGFAERAGKTPTFDFA